LEKYPHKKAYLRLVYHIYIYIYFKKSIFFQRRIGFNTIISQRTIRYLISEDKKKSLLEFVIDILIDDNEIR
jgi:hypothetical protein